MISSVASPRSNPYQPAELLSGELTFSLTDFLQRQRLGDGVVAADFFGEQVAMKVMDAMYSQEQEDEMYAEMKAYLHMQPLQGHVIPYLRAAGFHTFRAFPLIATQLINSKTLGWPLELEDEARQALLEGLLKIHDSGVLHGDIHPGNFLVREDSPKDIFWIDFGKSTIDASIDRNDARAVEEQKLLRAFLGMQPT
ncbi:hypothetical protein WJX73_002628 [Symbiochloris irregularis]|uniref:Protein kinase domain-containing protein n=1 Tax=Symbiochloris irregularis TaxID=706552 RepID=A0AAW1NPV7_9CHLO